MMNATQEKMKEMKYEIKVEMNASHQDMLAKLEANGKAHREATKEMMDAY
jgi:hypothetical protein